MHDLVGALVVKVQVAEDLYPAIVEHEVDDALLVVVEQPDPDVYQVRLQGSVHGLIVYGVEVGDLRGEREERLVVVEILVDDVVERDLLSVRVDHMCRDFVRPLYNHKGFDLGHT